jgi:hypothetical protein
MSDTILKDAFAAALLRSPDDPFTAALAVFGTDTRTALYVSQEWVRDLYVLQKQAELLEQFGEDEFLPSKATLARDVFNFARSTKDGKEKIAAYKLYAEVRGMIEKQTAIANVTVNNNRVMVVKDHGTDDDWETAARIQQAKLIEHSRD